jgi:N12 class adenine-specific DNA methylase
MAEVPAVETANNGPISRARASLAALETLERLRQAPHTPPSPDDLAALRGWSGWGPLAPALEYSRSGSWKEIGERIAYLLPQEHYDHGVQSTYNAFYTPPEIASACWDILTGLGFSHGKLLEPGCGAGVFMAATPPDVAAAWTGVERDPTTAAIAGLLHPAATVHVSRLEETALASRSVDAVLGNVPFGDTKVFDPTAPAAVTANLHNYFIWRSVQALRPGGVAVLLTSRYTLDAAGDSAQLARSAIAWDADLLGAIRLPNGALGVSGTDTVADILVLRRRRPDDDPTPQRDQWIATAASVADQQVNSYLLAHPQMVLGELAEDRAPRYGRTLRVDARPDDPPLPVALAAAGRAIVEHAGESGRTWRIDAGASPITAESAPFELRADGRKEGSFHLVDGVVHEVIEAQLVPVARPGKELPKLIELRDAVLELLDAETDHSRPDAELEPLRAEANQLYDNYVKAHGFLNRYKLVEGKPDEDGIVQSSRRRPSMGGFRRDPDFVTVLALEDFDDDTRTAAKAALLTRRVNRPRARATHAETPTEAIALCRDELGTLDLGRVAELLGVERGEAEQQIADVAFLDPETNQWVPSDEYLTGNVRQKLDYAKMAVALGADHLSRNVPALEAVIPADLQPEQILANLGAPWVPASDVQEFARDLLGFRAEVWNEPRTSTWSVRTSRRAEESAAATSEWGTGRLNAYKLLDYGLNGKAPTVYDVIDDKRVRNQDETLAANDRLDAIAARFATWVWEDPDRADRLAADYNRTFNAIVPRRFDGTHLTFPGMDADFKPYEHQADMVARMIAGSDALCPYPVGTGKTATMFMSAIKLKALGLVSKPLIIVVPSTLEQIARDGKRLFPNARILMAGKEDLADARARKLFAARSAMEDWDAVVMSHPSFTSLPVHPTVQADYAANLAAEYRTALISAKSESAEPRKIKQIAKMVDNLEAEAKRLLNHATDDGVFFEHLGVDYLLVDEMHYFKNLGVPVHTDGFSVNGSKRAQDLDMKLGWLRDRHPGLAVVTGFTGTPVSNTLLEAFILQHYLQPQRLEELGLQSADAWAANFVRFATAVEVTPDGGFKLNRRPAEIINIPDLINTVGEFAELRPPESFPVKRPEVRRHNVAIEASDTVLDFVRALAERADDIHAGGVPSSVDNILKICTDGRKVALHESLVGLEPEGPGKVGALVGNVARIYHETKDLELPEDDSGVRGRLQLIFCDLGTPNKDKGNQVYGLIRRELIAAGVPAERIRFIHEATTDARRLVLFDQCTKGEVAVLLGSTDKLGVGVNIQRRAVALHHVDAPWRPDQVEQRDGRVWRPKNLNPSVDIYRYVTEGSFDAFMWQALERKEKSLRPILAGQATARSVEDIGDVALDYGQIKAISTGNPLLTELNEVAFEVKRLTSLATSHQRTQRRLRSDIQTLTMQASAAATNVVALDAVAEVAAQNLENTRWSDTHGNPLAKDDEIAPLGALAESTIAKNYCNGAMQWRGLTVDFTANKKWRDTELAARVTAADRHRITVPLKVAWAAKGQHWRIRDAIATAVDEAHLTAAATRENIDVLKQRVTEHETALEQPFADADALDAARTRRAVLEAAIREQAQKDESARRNRPPRPLTGLGQRPDTGEERRQLLVRMRTAMSAVAERVHVLQDPQAPTSAPELEIPRPTPVPAPSAPEISTPPPAPKPVSEPEASDVAEPDNVLVPENVPEPPVAGRTAPNESAVIADPGSAPDPAPRPQAPGSNSPEQNQRTTAVAEPAPLTPTQQPAPSADRGPTPPNDTSIGATELLREGEADLAGHVIDVAPAPDEPTAGPVQDTASTPVARAEAAEPERTASAHRTGSLRRSWHTPMSMPVDKNPYDRNSVYAASCKDCEYLGPWHGREEGALEDGFDHAFPGWRELLPVVAAMEYEETQNKKAYAQWREAIVGLYPAGWVEAGGPVLVARNRGATRWHDDWFLGGNYSVCGVERAINLHAPARHKGRTRLVAASYQPREPLPVVSQGGPVGELTEQDVAAAVSGIFTPGKLVGLGTGLSDGRTLRAWLKARGQDSRDEHVGHRPAAVGLRPAFDTVTETRQGLAVVVLTDTERREGLITWSQAAEYLRPALTPEATARLSERYEEFQRFYADPRREIAPTLAALHALREQATTIHQDAANQVRAQVPTAETIAEDEVVLGATTTAVAPEGTELEPLLPASPPALPPARETSAAEPEPDEPEHQVQEPDYEQLYAEEFAQDTPDQAPQPAPGFPVPHTGPGPTEATNSADRNTSDALTEGDAMTEAVSEDTHEQARQTGDTASGEPTPQSSPPSEGRSPAPPRARERSEMLDHALDLALQGLAVFPLRPGTKVPLVKDWELKASTDVGQVMRWWSATPRANIGIACGRSGLLVVDLDADKKPGGTGHGQRSLLDLAAGRGIPRTLTVASARGGRHLYYRQPDGARFGNTAGRLGELIDTRGHGGYVVGPGSVFEGGAYRIEREAAVAQLPTWLAEELEQRRAPAEISAPEQRPSAAPVGERRRTAYGQAALRRAAASVESAREGTRNHTLNREAYRLGRLVGGAILDHEQAAAALRRAARKAGLPPEEADKTIASGLIAGIARPRSIPDHNPAPTARPGTTTKENTMSPTTTDALVQAADASTTTAANPVQSASTVPAEPVEQEAGATRSDDAATVQASVGARPDAVTPVPSAQAAVGPKPGPDEQVGPVDLDAIFADTLNRINAAREAHPDVLEFNDFDELQAGIDQVRTALAQTPITLRPAESTRTSTPNDQTDPTQAQASDSDSDEPARQADEPAPAPAPDLDEHLAAVDAAYTAAKSAGIPAEMPQWAGITAIHSAIHNLWDTLKAAAGTYWAELAADTRIHGLMAALATRASRAIAHLATTAAHHIEQRTTQQHVVQTAEPGLRETYINARNQIRGHAASHEWQRIAALWGTVNTLTRQTEDPSIRAVVARSADAISDHANTLARKITQYGDPGNTPELLNALARAAQGHATALRTESPAATPNTQPSPVHAATQPASSNSAVSPVDRGPDARALQQAAQQVARHAQQRLGLPARPQGGNTLRTPARNRGNAHHARPQQHAADQQPIVPGKSGSR